MRILFGIVLAVSFLSEEAFAKREDWYFGFNLGSGSLQMSAARTSTAASVSSKSTVADISIASGAFVYWPLFENFMLGIRTGGLGRSLIDTSVVNDQSRGYGLSVYTVNVHQSFGPEPGTGILLGAGAGLGFLYEANTSTFFSFENAQSGLGVLTSAGYGIATSEEARLFAELQFGIKLTGERANFLALMFGVMF